MNPTSFLELARLLPDPMLLVDDTGRILAVAPAAATLLGDPVPGGALTGLVVDDPEEVERFVRRCSRSTEPLPGAFTFREGGGLVRRQVRGGSMGLSDRGTSLLVLVRLLLDGSSLAELTSLTETVERLEFEINEHRRTERRLRVSESRLQAVLDHTSAVVYVKDLEGRYVLANRAMARLFGEGTTVDHVIGRTDEELFPHGDAVRFAALDAEVLRGTGPVTMEEHFERDGESRRSISVKVPLLDAEGVPYALAAVSTDMTEYFRAQQMLRERTRQLIEVQRIARIGSWTWDPGTGEVELSWEGEQVVGGAPGGRWTIDDIAAIIHRDDHGIGYQALDGVKNGQRVDVVLRVLPREGPMRWIQIRTEMTLDGAGRVIGTWQDVTEREEAERRRSELEAQLQQSQRMESVGRLAGGVAHDFNNLLAVMSIHAELARRSLDGGHPAEESLEQLQRAVDMATALTRQLMVFSKTQAALPSVVDLNALLLDIVALLRRTLGNNITLETDLAPDLAPILADSGRIEQVLVNLALNARDAMPSGGTLQLRTRNVTVGPRAGAPVGLDPGDYVELTVSDTGVGMTPETLARAVEPFFTTKPMTGGTGLGLATVYTIVHQADGELELRSEVGVGTDVVIWLPATQVSRDDTAELPSPSATQGAGETILVVEDQEPLAKLVTSLLEQAGYQVVLATDGVEAIEVAERTEQLHVLLTDVMLPKLSGSDLAERLCAERPSLRVVFMSGYTGGMLSDQATVPAGTLLLEKPFSTTELLEIVARALVRA